MKMDCNFDRIDSWVDLGSQLSLGFKSGQLGGWQVDSHEDRRMRKSERDFKYTDPIVSDVPERSRRRGCRTRGETKGTVDTWNYWNGCNPGKEQNRKLMTENWEYLHIIGTYRWRRSKRRGGDQTKLCSVMNIKEKGGFKTEGGREPKYEQG